MGFLALVPGGGFLGRSNLDYNLFVGFFFFFGCFNCTPHSSNDCKREKNLVGQATKLLTGVNSGHELPQIKGPVDGLSEHAFFWEAVPWLLLLD